MTKIENMFQEAQFFMFLDIIFSVSSHFDLKLHQVISRAIRHETLFGEGTADIDKIISDVMTKGDN